MLIRIVRMTFEESKVGDFLEIFESTKNNIRQFSGCSKLELLKDFNASNVFYTYSYWEDEASLDEYRHSELFKEVWGETKKLFSDKPLAFSAKQFIDVN